MALALRLYAEQRDEQQLQIVTKTLDAVARGGIHDHLGGGFHRYSVDPAWHVPHFEKLDYVNAQLLMNYLHAYQATGEQRYREVAEGIIIYVNRVLSDRVNGSFYARQDADMGPDHDGAYFTWTVQEVKEVLPPEEATVILRYYDITAEGDMESTPGRNVLRVATTPDANGKAHVPGPLDDYVWVAAALLHAFQVTGETRYLATARALMETALRTLWDDADGGFFDLRPDPTALGPLKCPSKSIEDTSIPSPNAMAAIVLDQLAALTIRTRRRRVPTCRIWRPGAFTTSPSRTNSRCTTWRMVGCWCNTIAAIVRPWWRS